MVREALCNWSPTCQLTSTNPKINLTATKDPNECVAALQVLTTPHNVIAALRYKLGRTRVMSMLDGSCMSRYPTKKMLVARLKSVPLMPRSRSSVPCRACARFERSRKLSRYMATRHGSRWRSTLRRRCRVRARSWASSSAAKGGWWACSRWDASVGFSVWASSMAWWFFSDEARGDAIFRPVLYTRM